MMSKRVPVAVIVVVSLAVSVLAVLGGGAIPRRTPARPSTPCECRMGSRSPSSEDTKAGRRSPSVTNEKVMAVILANPVMIKAYQSGIPGNGKPFPDGSRMAKIHWIPKKLETFPDYDGAGTPA